MVITVNKEINQKCCCGNPSRMVVDGGDHHHCLDCGMELGLTAWVGQVMVVGIMTRLIVCAPSVDAVVEYLRLTGVTVTRDDVEFNWLLTEAPENIPAVWQGKELLRDF